MKIPTKEECYKLLKENNVPINVIKHSEVVLGVCLQVYKQIGGKFELDQRVIEAVALLHDVERVKDNHVKAGEEYLKAKGFPEIGKIVGEHGLDKLPQSIYGKIIFYSDKRVKDDKMVSLEERFSYIQNKYERMPDNERERLYRFAKKIEEELGIEGDKIR